MTTVSKAQRIWIIVDSVLVGGVVPYWLKEFGGHLPIRLVVDVREGEAFVLFPV